MNQQNSENMDTQKLMHSIIERIATGPEFSKDIDFSEAEAGMKALLRGDINEVQAAIFLIALRMKRETPDENNGIGTAIFSEVERQNVDVPELIDIGDPYSGHNRSIPLSSFLPPLLAEMGLPSVIHGLKSVGPKYGITHHQIYAGLGLATDHCVRDAKMCVENPNIGWAYIDQNQYCPPLHHLVALRNLVIKRTIINTVETLTRPLGAQKTHALVGYVHKAYPPIYAGLAETSGFDTSILIRGVEGGVVPSLRQPAKVIVFSGTEEQQLEINPASIGIEQNLRTLPFPENMNVENDLEKLVRHTTKLGQAALSGERGIFYDGLLYAASVILWVRGRFPNLQDAALAVRETLDGGRTLNRLKN